MFAVASFLLAIFLAGAAYSFTRSSVVNQRDRAGIEQAYRDAQVAQNELSGNNPSAGAAIDRLQALGVRLEMIDVRRERTRGLLKAKVDAVQGEPHRPD